MHTHTQRLVQRISPRYYQRLLLIENEAKRIPMVFQLATVQSSFHADRLAEIMNSMIPVQALREFNELEIFSLLSSAYLHDIGFVISSRSEDIRKSHSAISAEFIRSEFGRLGLDPIEAFIISTICRAHTLDFDLSSISDILPVGRYKVRLRFLSALFRLADSLDIDFRRSPPIGIDFFTNDTRAKRLWKIHQSVSGIAFRPERGEIQIHFISFPEDISQKTIRQFIHNLEKVLNSVRQILIENDIPYRKIAYEIQRSWGE